MNTEYWLNVTEKGGRTEVLGGKPCYSEEWNFKIQRKNLKTSSEFYRWSSDV